MIEVVTYAHWAEAKEEVMELRRKGFGKFGLDDCDLVDEFDSVVSCNHLVARDMNGIPIGCSRLLFGRIEDLPIARLTKLAEVSELSGISLAEASRFSVISHRFSQEAKFGLWKKGLHIAIEQEAEKIVLSTRLVGALAYEALLFVDFGEPGKYRHEKRGGREHVSLFLDLNTVKQRFESHPKLFDYFFGDGEVPRLMRRT